METNEIIWLNVKALMIQKYNEENLYKLNKESAALGKDKEISLGSLTRIKAQNTDLRMSVLEKVANFFGLQPWQLLIDGLDPTNPPVFLNKKQQLFFDKMKSSYKELIEQ